MLLFAIIVAISASTLVQAGQDACFSDRSFKVDGRIVGKELQRLAKEVAFLNQECGGKPCQGRDYSKIIDDARDKVDEYCMASVGHIVGDLQVNQPEQAIQDCASARSVINKVMMDSLPRKSGDQVKKMRNTLTLVSFFEAEAYRLLYENALAMESLKETIARNSESDEIISPKEIEKTRLLIGLGKVAHFNSDVNLLLGQEQKASLDQVRSAYAKHRGSTKPFEQIVLKEALEKGIESPKKCDFCEFFEKLAIVEAGIGYKQLYEEILAELREFDDEFAQLVEKEIVEPLKAQNLQMARDAGKKFMASLGKKDGLLELKKVFDVRNIWSKKNRNDQKLEQAHLVSLRTYVYSFMVGLYAEADKLRYAAKLMSVIKADRLDHAGVSVGKVLQLQAKLAFNTAISIEN